MRPFHCPVCESQIYFDNTRCNTCGSAVGYHPGENNFVAVGGTADHAICANHDLCGCNWAVNAPGLFCLSCDLNEMIPPIEDPEQSRRWAEVEAAKRRLVYSIVRLGIPIYPKRRDATGLSFLILVNADHGGAGDVTMGHANGVITIDATEADAHLREFRRAELDERYRTLLGHMRHESGHYFWERLFLLDGFADAFRAKFGDEREDYGEALKRHYENGAPADWPEHYISAYATSHAWEDWAETFAHYLHIIDGEETFEFFRPDLTATPFDPYLHGRFAETLKRWYATSLMMNAMNRSLGHQDYYPFVLNDSVTGKLQFIDDWMARLNMA